MPSTRLTALATGALTLALSLPSFLLTAQAAPIGPAVPAVAAGRPAASATATPRIDWYACGTRRECAIVKAPLDYDQPQQGTIDLALLRVKATGTKIGSLFLNPGGPGGSGVEFADVAELFLSPALLAKYDIIGLDPRGVGSSTQVKCFPTHRAQTLGLTGFSMTLPWGSTEEQAHLAASARLSTGCGTTGKPLSASMSTANVARDLDLIRRALGEPRLDYLGFSYGSYLGQVYANLYPTKVGRLVIDGVLDPLAWAGTSANKSVPQSLRIKSAEGASRALRQLMKLCDQSPTVLCPLSGGPLHPGAALRSYDTLAKRLRAHPYVDSVDDFRFTYGDLVASTLASLYGPTAENIPWSVADLLSLTNPAAAMSASARKGKIATLKARLSRMNVAASRGYDFPYDNSIEAFTAVACTDSLNPVNARQWVRDTALADARAPYFGRIWGWSTSPCAGSIWKASDEDAYRGPFTRWTAHPVLVVGNYYDPGTNYEGAVRAAALLPNSRLLSSDSWGHTAYGTSACVTNAVDTYLLTGRLPAKGKVCKGDYVPFTPDQEGSGSGATTRRLPPVVPPLPGR